MEVPGLFAWGWGGETLSQSPESPRKGRVRKSLALFFPALLMKALGTGTVCCHGESFLRCWAWETHREDALCYEGAVESRGQGGVPVEEDQNQQIFPAALAERGIWGNKGIL